MHLAKSHALSTPDYTMFSCAECNYKSNSKVYLSFHKKRMHTARPGLWMCMAGACKEKLRSFWTNTNKTMPMWIAQCAINHLVQSEIWRGTWKPFIKQWRWMCLETQIIPIQTTISMSRMKSSTMLPFWWTLCFDSHSTCQHSWTICTKLVQW